MAFEKKFELEIYVSENVEVAGHMPDLWAQRLGDSGGLIKDKLDEKFPDEGAFINGLVKPSEDGFRPLIDSSFISRHERTSENIRSARRENLTQSFLRWKENLAKVFATVDGVVAKVFKDKVLAAKDRWALKVGAGTLRMTGDKIRGRGPAPIVAFYLVGDNRAIGDIFGLDLSGVYIHALDSLVLYLLGSDCFVGNLLLGHRLRDDLRSRYLAVKISSSVCHKKLLVQKLKCLRLKGYF